MFSFIQRRIHLFIVVTFIAAMAMSFGCRHSNYGALDPVTVTPDDWWEAGTKDTSTIEVSIGGTDEHSIDLLFSKRMKAENLNIIITDSSGREITNFRQKWQSDRHILRLVAPFAFCADYTITVKAGATSEISQVLEEDLTIVAHTAKNPLDFDQSASCTADVVVSPIFGADGAILKGDIVSAAPYKQLRHQDLDNQDTFYVDYSGDYDGAGPMVLMPFMLETGSPVLTQLFNKKVGANSLQYELDLWETYEPAGEQPSSSINYTIDDGFWELSGPRYAGDVTGDGVSELTVSAESILTAGALQKVFLLKGPVARGDGLLLTDIAGSGNVMGNSKDTLMPFVSVGDIDGDGSGELGAMMMTDELIFGIVNKWEIWILPGQAESDKMFVDPMWKLTGHLSNVMMDMDAGDLDGDGDSDLIVAETEYIYARVDKVYRHVRPIIGILLGGDSLDGRSMDTTDSVMNFWMQEDTSVNVRVFGDINGDGMDDMGILLTQKNVNGQTISSKIYLFVGREIWMESYNPASTISVGNNAEIDVLGADVADLEGAAIGDINNDGYDDFKITGDDGTNKTIYIFFGGQSYTGNKMTLDDADVIWDFTP